MSLFGAATSGVDPQSGSYLSKEQRVAMFRASRGQGGGTGTPGGSGPQKAVVNPQNAIVVANKMTSVVQKLQTSYQETTNTVAEQVAQNKRDLQSITNVVSANRKSKLAEDKAETKQLRTDRLSRLRQAREGLVEGLSKAGSGIIRAGQAAANKVVSPIQGLLQRLLGVIGSLVAAWAFDNFDTILNWALNLGDRIGDLIDDFTGDWTNIRGAWSILDNLLGGVKRFIGKVARKAFNLGRFIAKKGWDIGKKVFNSIIEFTGRVIKRIFDSLMGLGRRVKDFLAGLLPGAKDGVKGADAARDAARGADAARDAARGADAVTPSGGAKAITPETPKAKPKGNFFSRGIDSLRQKLGDFGAGAKNMFDKGIQGIKDMGGSLQSKFAGKDKKVTPKQANRLQGILEKVMERAKLPPALAKTLTSGAGRLGGLLRRLPAIGFAIDYMLNSSQGMDFEQNLIRSLGSSLAGMGGAAAGAKIGGGIGFVAGSVVPVLGNVAGAAIGAALGAILGGIIGGTAGDKVGAVAYESYTGKKAMETDTIGGRTIGGAIDSVLGRESPSGDGNTPKPKIQSTPNTDIFSKGSFDSNLSMPSQVSPTIFQEMTNAPIDMRQFQESGEKTPSPSFAVGTQIPTIPSSNPETSIYRDISLSEYQLAG
jgi:hypothetical protein